MITKRTTYAIYGFLADDNGTQQMCKISGTAIPYVKSTHDIETWEAQVSQETKNKFMVKTWFPIRIEYLWFVGLKNLLKKKTK